MKSPFWPRTFRDWLAVQLLRLAGALAESDRLYDASLGLSFDRRWRQPTHGEALMEGVSK